MTSRQPLQEEVPTHKERCAKLKHLWRNCVQKFYYQICPRLNPEVDATWTFLVQQSSPLPPHLSFWDLWQLQWLYYVTVHLCNTFKWSTSAAKSKRNQEGRRVDRKSTVNKYTSFVVSSGGPRVGGWTLLWTRGLIKKGNNSTTTSSTSCVPWCGDGWFEDCPRVDHNKRASHKIVLGRHRVLLVVP